MSTPTADDRRARYSNSQFAPGSPRVVQVAAIVRAWRPASARFGSWLDDLGSRRGKAGLSLAVGLWLLILVLSEPGHVWSAAQEAWCYWIPSILDPYRQSDWTSPVAYVYSPAFLEFIAPLRALSWTAFVAVWAGMLLVAIAYLSGLRLLWLGVLDRRIRGVRRQHLALPGGGHRARLSLARDLGIRPPHEGNARRRPAVVRCPARMAEPRHRPGGDRCRGGRICPDHATGLAAVGARPRRERGSRRDMGCRTDRLGDTVADRRRGRRLGGQD